MSNRISIAVWISGGGTTLRNLLEKIDAGLLQIDVKLVIASKSTAGGLEHARQANIPELIIRRTDYELAEDYCRAMFDPCREAGVDYVVMGGFLKHVLIPPDFENRVLNIHPSLIPAFCGHGMYGHFVHEAVINYGAKISGCTVHFVDNEFDHGPIILQRTVAVKAKDSPSDLALRVFEAECEAYPTALQWLANGRIHVDDRKVVIS
ncbi:MAG: phosphoribosylglycinamide formyltransferase [Planctomycetaceae bacterium]|nr:phosphoribosylglycinamide formyltransferase [Planctomycetaceae bacterium]